MPSAFIAGCLGPQLSETERRFFRDADPWGLILFRRNVTDPEGLAALTASFRECVGRADAPVVIDQEGGRVQRMGPPHWPKYPAGRAYGRIGDEARRRILTRVGARLIAEDLRAVGITIDCLPVLDIPAPGSDPIVGDRAYGDEPDIVAALGREAAEGLIEGGVLPVMKHAPGHGRATIDSHEALPRVDTPLDDLRRRDFQPFRALRDLPIAMTAHVVFTAIDSDNPGTTSSAVIGTILRGEIGFDGLLLTDDLSMKALSGSFRERTAAALAAGCDIALHCNGEMDEAEEVATAAPRLSGAALRRAEAALARLRSPLTPFDPVSARAELDDALASVA